jgi:hypothetical protein
MARGEHHWRSKLSEPQIAEIRSRYANGERVCDIARLLGATYGSVRFAAKGWTWKHIPAQAVSL